VKDYQYVNLETLNSGAVMELFDDAWQKLINNIQDVNTKPDAVRKVKIEIAVKPAKDRRNAATSVSVIPTLAAVVPHEASIVIGVEGGKVQAFTFDPNQQGLDFEEEDAAGSSTVRQFQKEAK
jgi:hypothetical protein